jgi:hypothetical protein
MHGMPDPSATLPVSGAVALRRLAIAVLAAGAISGCSWGEKYRKATPRETLELESFTVPLPDERGWRVTRERDVGWRTLEAFHDHDAGAWDRQVFAGEGTRPQRAATREERVAWARKEAVRLLGDPNGAVTELPVTPDPRFGPSAVVVLVRAEQSDASAGLLVKRAASVGVLEFVPPQAPDRVAYLESVGVRRGLTAEEAAQRWDALVGGVALRPVDERAIAAAARPDFPKKFEPRFSHRSLTLPAHGLRFEWQRERFVAPDGSSGSGSLAYGITDKIEVSLPGYLKFAFGEPEAIVRPEVVVGAGWTRFESDAARGNVWGGAVNAAARKRLGEDVDVIAGGFLEATHESRTGENALYGGAAAGVRWDPPVFGVADLLGLGLEVGWESRDVGLPSRRLAWIGGRQTPLVTVHVPLLDLGLTGGLGWDGEDVGALVGLQLGVTF